MRLSPIVGCVVLAAPLAGCGGGGGGGGPETLTCAWLASADNCWSNVAVMARPCLPPESDSGTFNASNSACTYPGGEVVNFTPALILPLPDEPTWNFTVNGTNGQACVHYEENTLGIKLVVGTQTVSNAFAGFSMTITCPDGTSVHTGNAFNLLDCPDAGIAALPGHFIGYTDTSVSFAVIGTNPTSVPLFDCSK